MCLHEAVVLSDYKARCNGIFRLSPRVTPSGRINYDLFKLFAAPKIDDKPDEGFFSRFPFAFFTIIVLRATRSFRSEKPQRHSLIKISHPGTRKTVRFYMRHLVTIYGVISAAFRCKIQVYRHNINRWRFFSSFPFTFFTIVVPLPILLITQHSCLASENINATR